MNVSPNELAAIGALPTSMPMSVAASPMVAQVRRPAPAPTPAKGPLGLPAKIAGYPSTYFVVGLGGVAIIGLAFALKKKKKPAADRPQRQSMAQYPYPYQSQYAYYQPWQYPAPAPQAPAPKPAPPALDVKR